MKKWNNPEITELDLKMTADSERECKDNAAYYCDAPGNGNVGKGQCDKCTLRGGTRPYAKLKLTDDPS